MIALWIVYASAIGLLLWGAAAAVDRVARQLGYATRGVWTTALAASVLLPLLLVVAAPPGGDGGDAVGGSGYLGVPETLIPAAVPSVAALRWAEPLAIAIWLLASLAVAFVFLRAAAALRSIQREWRVDTLAGAPVLVSSDVGPAVVGVLRGRIVVPEWVLAFDGVSQRLLLRHEREHIRAGDHRILGFATLAVVAFPWSPGLWRQLRRLREAVELDCDARVLRSGFDRPRYGTLLLSVAERMVRPSVKQFGLAAATPPLERRIRRLTGQFPRLGLPGLVATGGAAVLMTLVIPLLPAPELDLPALLPERTSAVQPGFPAGTRSPGSARPILLNAHEAPGILERAYPTSRMDTRIGGTAILLAYVGARGTVEETAVQESSGHPDLDAAAEVAVRQFRYRAGRIDGADSGMWIPQSVTFIPPAELERAAVDLPPPAPADGSRRLAIWTSPIRSGSS